MFMLGTNEDKTLVAKGATLFVQCYSSNIVRWHMISSSTIGNVLVSMLDRFQFWKCVLVFIIQKFKERVPILNLVVSLHPLTFQENVKSMFLIIETCHKYKSNLITNLIYVKLKTVFAINFSYMHCKYRIALNFKQVFHET